MVMGRPKKDPDERRGITLTFKVTNAEHLRLTRLAKHREEEIRQTTGQHFDVPMSGYLRWLVDCDAQKRGIVLEEPDAPEPKRVRKSAPAKRSPPSTVPAKKKAPKATDLRDELAPYRERHKLGQRALAPKIGVQSQSSVSALEAKKKPFSPASEAAFRKLLAAEG